MKQDRILYSYVYCETTVLVGLLTDTSSQKCLAASVKMTSRFVGTVTNDTCPMLSMKSQATSHPSMISMGDDDDQGVS
jgi:hypothetical protein